MEALAPQLALHSRVVLYQVRRCGNAVVPIPHQLVLFCELPTDNREWKSGWENPDFIEVASFQNTHEITYQVAATAGLTVNKSSTDK